MDEFEPQKKEKIFTKSFISRYLYIFILGIVVLFGSSYSLTFFVQNKKIATGSLKTAALTIDFTDRNINATSLSIPTSDKEGLKEFVKNLVIENTAQVDGKVKVTLDRTSGLNLTDLRYALSINGTIIKIDDVPSNGVILETAIFSGETINVEVRLWPKTTYSGTEATFKGTLTPEIRYLGTVASSYSDLTNKYVNFNCTGNTCEKWRIVKVEDNRLVLTREADLEGATSRTNSGKFDSSQNFNDSTSLVTSLSTDNKNVYLAKTVKINGGKGTSDEPYILVNNNYSNQDEKVIAIITYDNDGETSTQPVYYNKTNYISQEVDDEGFQGWTNNSSTYHLGDIINFTSNTTLTASWDKSALSMLKKNVITPATPINFGNISSNTNGKGLYILPGTESDTNPIYYYRGAVDNNNVIFGGFCWLMVRTTETGGIKMIYNGVVTGTTDNPTCTNATTARQIGASDFNTKNNSMLDVGYMYNQRYISQSKAGSYTETMLSSTSLNTTYWYADNITWGSPTANKYNLDNPYQVASTTDYPNLVGKYTFRNTSQTYTNTSVYYIAGVNNTTMYYINLSNTGNHTLADFNNTYTYGDGYTDLGNGTYEITDTNSVTTINQSDWYTSYSNLTNKYVCKNATNNTCSEVRYVTSTTNTTMTYLKEFSNIKFSKGISNYNAGTYTLDDDNAVSFWDITNTTNKESLNNAHYTCWNESGTCTTLSYIYYLNGTTYNYINLTDGDLVEDALYKMTGNGSSETKAKNAGYVLNKTSSKVKTNIENWFKTNLTNEVDASKINYQEYLEDTIWCNDRSYSVITGMGTYEEAGWNPNGGSLTTHQYFAAGGRRWINNHYSRTNVPVMACPNVTDQFRVGNQEAKLNYPVGLLTMDEIILAGAAGNNNSSNTTYYLYIGSGDYWSLSPSNFYGSSSSASGFYVNSSSITNYGSGVNYPRGLRPSVSLKPGTEFEDGGLGTTSKPYMVKTRE